MIIDEITNKLFEGTENFISEQEEEIIKNKLTIILYDFELKKKETTLSTQLDNNKYYLQEFKRSLRMLKRSERTIYNYVNATQNFLKIINKNFKDITTTDINYYLTILSEKGTLICTSLDNERKFIKPFFKWAVKNDLILSNPFDKIDPIKRSEKRKEILSDAEIEMLRDTAKNNKKESAIIDFLLATGIRISECSKAKVTNINFNDYIMNIYGEKTQKWREVYLDIKACKHVVEYLEERTKKYPIYGGQDSLFLQDRGEHLPMSPYCINKMLKNIAKRAGITKHCTCHLFRKTLASKLSAKGLSSQKIAMILGNSTAVSEKYYILVSRNDLKNDYNRCMN